MHLLTNYILSGFFEPVDLVYSSDKWLELLMFLFLLVHQNKLNWSLYDEDGCTIIDISTFSYRVFVTLDHKTSHN